MVDSQAAAAASAQGSCSRRATYARREPEKGVLVSVVEEHLEKFLAEARDKSRDGAGVPRFVEAEFRKLSACGQLDRGFILVECEVCGEQRPVAFSCKASLCPSCGTRRMHEACLRLVGHVIPLVPVRQWVLTFPPSVRFVLAFDPELTSAALAVFTRALFAWQKKKARAMGLEAVQVGAVSFIQRFSDSIGLFLHVHALVPEGVFTEREAGDGLDFHKLAKPTEEEVAALAAQVAKRTQALFERRGIADREGDDFAATAAAWIDEAQRRASVSQGLAEERKTSLLARAQGYTLQAGTFLHEHDREGLARLVRYALRPPLAESRLSRSEGGRIVLRLKKLRPDGTRELVLTPMELLRRLSLLVPPPRSKSIRFHGIFAGRARARAKLRSRWVEEQLAKEAEGQASVSPKTMDETELFGAWMPQDVLPVVPAPSPAVPYVPWAELLRRTLAIDALRCPRCGGAMQPIALVLDPDEIEKTLERLRSPRRRDPASRGQGPAG